MASYRRLKPHERSQVIGARANGTPSGEVSIYTRIKYRTLQRTWAKRNERDDQQHDLKRSGRPRKTTEDQDTRLYRHLRISPLICRREILDLTSLSRTQVQQRLAEIDSDFKNQSTYLGALYRRNYAPTTLHILQGV